MISSVFFVFALVNGLSSKFICVFFLSRLPRIISFLGMDYFKNTALMINPFSLEPLFWGFGDSLAYYTSAILLIGFCGIILIVFQSPSHRSNKASNAPQSATCFTPPILYGANDYSNLPDADWTRRFLRYLCPVIIAAAPSAMIMAATSVSEAKAQIDTQRRFVKKSTFVIAFFVACSMGFFRIFN
ncbi:MAG: hypothetical protein MZV70_75965 [Desulfobacterales bacterium]|nr:hypothetical protein [Desulfobacterales bacterium]